MRMTGLKPEGRIDADSGTIRYLFHDDVDPGKLREMRERLERSMLPASEADIAKGLLKLRALTSHRDAGIDIDVILEAYVEKLQQYPADAVLESLDRLAYRYKWWPSWLEISEDVEFRCRRRVELRIALERRIGRIHESEEGDGTGVRENGREAAEFLCASANQGDLGNDEKKKDRQGSFYG